MTVSHLDRLAIEKLFRVRERRARQLMASLPGLQVGNAFAVERLALLSWLERTARGDDFQWETVRRTRVGGLGSNGTVNRLKPFFTRFSGPLH